MCTKEIRDKFQQLFDQFTRLKQLSGEDSLGFRENLLKLVLAVATKLIVSLINKNWRE